MSWLLDSPGCSGHRSGDSEVVGVENSHRCPPAHRPGRAVRGGRRGGRRRRVLRRSRRTAVRSNAHAAELEALEARSRRSALRSSALDLPHDEYDSFIDVEEEDEETCVNEEVLDDGDVVCGVEDPFEFAFYPSSKAEPKRTPKTKNEFADDADERRARDDESRNANSSKKPRVPRRSRGWASAQAPRRGGVDPGRDGGHRAGVDCVRGFRSVARG